MTSSPQHIARPSISSSPTAQSSSGLHCGTKSQPWLLEAPSGQRINISILEFTPSEASTSDTFISESVVSRKQSEGSHSSCVNHRRQYGYVIDKSAAAASKKNVSICSGIHRIANVYLSTSSSVEIVLTTPFRGNHTENYLIRFEGDILYTYSFQEVFNQTNSKFVLFPLILSLYITKFIDYFSLYLSQRNGSQNRHELIACPMPWKSSTDPLAEKTVK